MYRIIGSLGLLLIIAPFVFGYSNNQTALLTSVVLGCLTVLVSWIEKSVDDTEEWEYWAAATMGIVAIAAPFIFDFNSQSKAFLTTALTGLLIAFFAGSKIKSFKHHENNYWNQ